MESKKAKILAGAAVAVLLVLELSLYLCFHLSRPFYLSTAVILSAVLSASVVTLLHHALNERRRAERMARRPSPDGEELRVEYSYFRKVAGLPCKYSFEALAAATDGFQYTVGRGSSGSVAADKAREGRVMDVLDRRLVDSGEAIEEAAVRRLVHVALWCAQEKAGARPSMARVVEMLEGRGAAAAPVEAPPPSDMIVVDLLALDPARGRGPFGLPLPTSSAGGGMQETSSRPSNSFALSYLSGR
ncbi:hypothetical protein ABZP36_022940 [Zizania latifolia]